MTRVPWFPALRAFVEGGGYEVVTMGDGNRSAVPRDEAPALADLERAERMAQHLGVAVEELERRLPLGADPLTEAIIHDGRALLAEAAISQEPKL